MASYWMYMDWRVSVQTGEKERRTRQEKREDERREKNETGEGAVALGDCFSLEPRVMELRVMELRVTGPKGSQADGSRQVDMKNVF